MKTIKIKVYINRVKIDYQKQFARAQAYFAKHNVTVTFDFQIVDVRGYSTYIAHWPPPHGDRLLIQGAEKLVTLDPAYDMTIFAFNGEEFPVPNIPTSNCFTLGKQAFINLQTHLADPVDLDYVTICHEMMHGLTRLAWMRGFPWIIDNMDTYRENQQLDSPTGNFAEQWGYLKPYIGSPVVTVNRTVDDGKQTLGTLHAGAFSCKTLEQPWRDNKINISCIPKGTYQVAWTLSLRFMKYTYQIMNVPGRSGIRIHSGNYFFDVEGCIEVGDIFADINHDGELDVLNSKVTLQRFEDAMGRLPFQLVIA